MTDAKKPVSNPFPTRAPFKNPFLQSKPNFPKNNSRQSSSFRTQNRGGGGK